MLFVSLKDKRARARCCGLREAHSAILSWRTPWSLAVNLSKLQEIADKYSVTEISAQFLYDNGYTRRDDLVKILAQGELKAKLNVSAHACSEAAKAAIEAAGGSITVA